MTTRETLALVSKLAPSLASLYALHMSYAAFRLNTYEQFHVRGWFRTLVITVDNKQRIWQNTLHDAPDGVCTKLDIDSNSVLKCYWLRHQILQGKYVRHRVTGQIQMRCTYINGQLNGVYTAYYANGRAMYERTYVDDKLHGEWVSYYYNGMPQARQIYVNGVKHGVRTMYSQTGAIACRCMYVNGEYCALAKAS